MVQVDGVVDHGRDLRQAAVDVVADVAGHAVAKVDGPCRRR